MPAATSCTSAKKNQCYADLWSKNKASLLGDILGVDKISHFPAWCANGTDLGTGMTRNDPVMPWLDAREYSIPNLLCD